jgi:hypothetical protein
LLYFLKIVTLGASVAVGGWVGYSVIPDLTLKQALAVCGFVAVAFFLGLFFGMDEDE